MPTGRAERADAGALKPVAVAVCALATARDNDGEFGRTASPEVGADDDDEEEDVKASAAEVEPAAAAGGSCEQSLAPLELVCAEAASRELTEVMRRG